MREGRLGCVAATASRKPRREPPPRPPPADPSGWPPAQAEGTSFAGNLAGCLAQVFVWDHPLEAHQIATMTTGFDYTDPNLGGLAAHYPLEEGAGAVAVDSVSGKLAPLLGGYAPSQGSRPTLSLRSTPNVARGPASVIVTAARSSP